ncbi:hypothetical protein HK103_004153, partial [Boothiomyces macroporosus]
MTTKQHRSTWDKYSFYWFWTDRASWIIEPMDSKKDVLEKRLVSQTLVDLCIRFLFSEHGYIQFSQDLDLVTTNLVMISVSLFHWSVCMSEPLVLAAGLNFLADMEAKPLSNYFASKLFSPLSAPHLTPQERGNILKIVIALRFRQGWWKKPVLQKYLPKWINPFEIPEPKGIFDCRSGNGTFNLFLQQLANPQFPWLTLPAVKAGPDLRYSVFS